MDRHQERMIGTMREILQEKYLALEVRQYTTSEDLVGGGGCRIACELRIGAEGRAAIEGEGVGMIDALFAALKAKLAPDYPSLESIRFSQFSIRGLIAGGGSASASEAEAVVGIENSAGTEFIFVDKARSIGRAGVQATVRAAEYFVNSERTFVRLHEILEHYRSEGRTDLVEKYTSLMSEVVRNTSYSEVVERIRDKM